MRSLLFSVRRDLVKQQQTAESIARLLAPALDQFSLPLSLARNLDINNIDAASTEDLRFISRLQGDSRYTDLSRESYIEELAGSIDRNGASLGNRSLFHQKSTRTYCIEPVDFFQILFYSKFVKISRFLLSKGGCNGSGS